MLKQRALKNWEVTSNSCNFQTTRPNDLKFEQQLYMTIIFDFGIHKFPRKPTYQGELL